MSDKLSKLAPRIRAEAYSREAKLTSYGLSRLPTKIKSWVKSGLGEAYAQVIEIDVIAAIKCVSVEDVKSFTIQDTMIYLEYLLLLDSDD